MLNLVLEIKDSTKCGRETNVRNVLLEQLQKCAFWISSPALVVSKNFEATYRQTSPTLLEFNNVTIGGLASVCIFPRTELSTREETPIKMLILVFGQYEN